LETIDSKVFDNCTALKEIVIPSQVKRIRNKAVWGCNKLASVTFLGENVENIYSYAFQGCNSLTNIIIRCRDIPHFTYGAFDGVFVPSLKILEVNLSNFLNKTDFAAQKDSIITFLTRRFDPISDNTSRFTGRTVIFKGPNGEQVIFKCDNKGKWEMN
jgi:hypothetical protein